MRGSTLGLKLSWLWIAVVILYLAWGWTEEAGLLYWLGTLEVDRLGTYLPPVNGIVSFFLLVTPALWFIVPDARRQRLAPPDPVAGARNFRLVAFVTIGLGVLGYIIAATCFIAALYQPSGAERAVPFDVARLGSGAPPVGQVRLAGRADDAARAIFRDSGRGGTWTMTYTGFRAAGEADKQAPLSIFVERRINGEFDPAAPHAGREESGYLIENGLPPLIRYTLEQQGVGIATPHYLLRTGSSLRQPYYVGAALGTLFGAALIAIGVLLLLLPRRGMGARRPEVR